MLTDLSMLMKLKLVIETREDERHFTLKCFLFFISIHVKIYVMKIKEILECGKNNLIEKEEGLRLSKMLLKHLLNVNDSYLIINSDKELEISVEEKFKEGIKLLKEGMPLQYITNHQEFMGLSFYVDSNVLIPQPDTENLVEEVLDILKRDLNKKTVLDMCTGSGAIGISIAKYSESSVTMSDISKNALEIAKKNATSNEVIDKCKFLLSDMFENIEGKFDIIVSNPPYIKTKVINTLDIEVQNEPMLALDGGEDGLNFYRIIAENAYKYLNEDGILAVEIGYDQKEKVMSLLEKVGQYADIYCKKDLGDNDRIIVCKLNDTYRTGRY